MLHDDANGASARGCGERRIVITMRGRRAEDHWLVDGLRRRGFCVSVVGAAAPASLRPAALRRRLDKGASLWLSWKGARLAATGDAVLVAHNYMAALLGSLVPPPRGRRRAPVVGLNMILINDGAGLLPRRALHRIALRKPGVTVTVNTAHLAERYANLLRVPRDRFAVLPDCWPTRAVFRTPTPEGDFVFVGGKCRDWPMAVRVAEGCPEIPFEFIAREIDWPRGLVAPPNVHIRLDTSASDFYAALRACRLALIAYRPGGNLGLIVLIHGVIGGKPVVATRTPEIEPYYPRECDGLLVPPADSDRMGDVVRRLWNDQEEAQRVAVALQVHVRVRFSPRRYLTELAGIIDGLDESGSARRGTVLGASRLARYVAALVAAR